MLEIGCGTGQATVPLAERGYRVVAVEMGTDMAAVARRNLAAFDSVEVVTAVFERWPLPVEPFDVVFSATAFHWIDPAVRVAKSADALRLGGLLATVGTGPRHSSLRFRSATSVSIRRPHRDCVLRLLVTSPKTTASSPRRVDSGQQSSTDTNGSCRTRQLTTWICC